METIAERPPPAPSRPPRPSEDLRSKEQRRRERRERRAARRQQQNFGHFRGHDPFTIYGSVYGSNMPDILNSHLPPPAYSTLPHTARTTRSGTSGQPQVTASGPPPTVRSARPRRWRPLPNLTGVTTDLQRSHFLGEDDPKSCCGVTVTQTVSIRWFIVMIAFVGICCSIVGTVLGAMKASGREHLTVSLLMIGVGIVLITVSGIAWRLTATDAPSCRAMLGLGGGCDEDYNNGRFLSRPQVTNTNNTASRPQHPYAAMMYSDFPYRPPPPSYQASMQEYRLRLLLLDRNTSGNPTNPGPSLAEQQSHQQQQQPVVAPPNYRAHLRNAMLHAMNHSRPPSYKSHISDHPVIESGSVPQVLQTTTTTTTVSGSGIRSSTSEQIQVAQVHPVPGTPPEPNHQRNNHSREGSGQDISIVPVVSPTRHCKTDLYHVKTGDNPDFSGFSEQLYGKNEEKRSVVTIVQTSSTNSDPVIVTVSGSLENRLNTSSESGSDFSDIRASPAEVEILATL